MFSMTNVNLQDRLAQLASETNAPTPVPQPAVVASPSPRLIRQAPLKRTNRYGGKCVRCHKWVEPQGGFIGKDDGQWIVYHDECPVDAPAPIASVQANPVRHGIYTVESDKGHATFKISHQADDAKFAPGQDIIGVMEGTDNTSYYPIGFVRKGQVNLFKRNQGVDLWWKPFLSRLISNPEVALESLKCRRCNRDLTTPESLALGIGPECAKNE